MKLIRLATSAVVTSLLFAMPAESAVGMAKLRIQIAQSNEQWWGSAVCVGPSNREGEWVFLTAKHNVEGVDIGGRDKAYLTIGGEWVPVTSGALCDSQHDDVAILGVKYQLGIGKYARIADGAPDGTAVHTAGYPAGGKLRMARGRMQRGDPIVPDGVSQGESGGGVFDEHDRLIGIISGYVTDSPSTVVVTTCDRIRGWYGRRGWPCPPCQNPSAARPVERVPPSDVPGPPFSPEIESAPPPPIEEPDTPSDAVSASEVWEAIEGLRSQIAAIPTGPQGPIGPPGERGEAGPPGQRGEPGLAGSPGPAGPVGRSGKDGVNGRPGRDGTNGNPGRDGKDGAFIASAQVRNGRLILIRSDGREIDAGLLPVSGDTTDISQRVAALESQVEQPFDVQLFVNGKPATDVRSVQPHGGWLPIDLPWEVVKPQQEN